MQGRMVLARTLGAIAVSLSVAACGGGGSRLSQQIDTNQSLDQYSAQQIFERGEFELARNRSADAAFYFGEIERLYPYSEWAPRALIMQAFAYHQGKDYPESRAASQRYIDFYPAEEDAAYAQYLLALSYYDQIDEVGATRG